MLLLRMKKAYSNSKNIKKERTVQTFKMKNYFTNIIELKVVLWKTIIIHFYIIAITLKNINI